MFRISVFLVTFRLALLTQYRFSAQWSFQTWLNSNKSVFFSALPWHLEILYPFLHVPLQIIVASCCFNSFSVPTKCVFASELFYGLACSHGTILYKHNKQYIVQRHYIFGPCVEPLYFRTWNCTWMTFGNVCKQGPDVSFNCRVPTMIRAPFWEF